MFYKRKNDCCGIGKPFGLFSLKLPSDRLLRGLIQT